MSAGATTGRIERLLEQGASAYLAKPIDVQQFLEVNPNELACHTSFDTPVATLHLRAVGSA